MVDLDAALGEQLFDIAVGQPEPQVPADGQDDDIAWKVEAGERKACNAVKAGGKFAWQQSA